MTARFGTYTVNHQIVKPFLERTELSNPYIFAQLSPSRAPRTAIFPCARFLYVEPDSRSSNVVTAHQIISPLTGLLFQNRDFQRVNVLDGTEVGTIRVRQVRELPNDVESLRDLPQYRELAGPFGLRTKSDDEL